MPAVAAAACFIIAVVLAIIAVTAPKVEQRIFALCCAAASTLYGIRVIILMLN